MTHPRIIIRETLRDALIRAGAWEDSVHVERVTAIESDDVFPNICIYVQNERTRTQDGGNTWMQEAFLLVEVRAHRQPNMNDPPRHKKDGEGPAQTGQAWRMLDDACEHIEQIVIGTFNRRTVNGVRFEPITEINTDIARSDDGEVPYLLASIEFKLTYSLCGDPIEPDSCPLEHFYGIVTATACDGSEGMPARADVHTLQPEQTGC